MDNVNLAVGIIVNATKEKFAKMVNAKKDVPKTQIVMEGLDVLETNACLRVSQIAIVNLIVIAILITDVVFQNVNLILAVKENTDVLMAIASSLVLHQLNVQIISNTATSKYHINLIFYCKMQGCHWVFKSGWASSTVVDIICSPGWNRVN